MSWFGDRVFETKYKKGGSRMRPNTLTDLIEAMEEALRRRNGFTLVIANVNTPQPEQIYNPADNLVDKIRYVQQAYNENLTLKSAPEVISIIDWTEENR